MTSQRPHYRTSRRGRRFPAGRGRKSDFEKFLEEEEYDPYPDLNKPRYRRKPQNLKPHPWTESEWEEFERSLGRPISKDIVADPEDISRALANRSRQEVEDFALEMVDDIADYLIAHDNLHAIYEEISEELSRKSSDELHRMLGMPLSVPITQKQAIDRLATDRINQMTRAEKRRILLRRIVDEIHKSSKEELQEMISNLGEVPPGLAAKR